MIQDTQQVFDGSGVTCQVPGHGWRFDGARLAALADQLGSAYRSAPPYPHIVIDGLWPDALLREVVAGLPPLTSERWETGSEGRQQKLWLKQTEDLPVAAASAFGLLQSVAFLRFLDRLSGIDGLIGDPYLHHGGVHAVRRGGYLTLHSDQAFQPEIYLNRRLNIVVYLNERWEDGWGGSLELWSKGAAHPARVIAPLWNRTVVWDAEPPALHGHPQPLECPDDVVRLSLAQYYYTSPSHPALPWLRNAIDRFQPANATWRTALTSRTKRLVVEDLSPPAVTRALRRRMAQRRSQG